jgi:hypothetical protein
MTPQSARQPVIPVKDERTDPPYVLGEREMLETWLELHRATLTVKCSGLDAEQLCERSAPPSSLSLLGLVRHMAEVERNWFQRVLDGRDVPGIYYSDESPDGDFADLEPGAAQQDVATWEQEVALSRRLAAARTLDDTGTRHGEEVSLRWIYVHMIEEYARHNGHADLLRERIDGTTGE